MNNWTAWYTNASFELVWYTDNYDIANTDISYNATGADCLAVEYFMDGYTRGGMDLISLHPNNEYAVWNITYFGSDTGDFATGAPMMWVRQLTGITRTGMHIGPSYGIYIRNNNTLTGFNYHVKPARIYSVKLGV